MRSLAICTITVVVPLTGLFAQADSTGRDSALLKEMEMMLDDPGSAERGNAVAAGGGSRSLSITNPRISAITDLQGAYRYSGEKNYAANLNEVEFAFLSAIDPYARADIYFSLEKEPAGTRMLGGIEEAYLTTLSLPFHLQLRAGRFKNAIGRANIIHSHAQPFIEAPQVLQNYLGDGLSGDGLSLSWLVPQSLFYQELTAEVTDGPVESPVFTAGQFNDFLYSAHLKNFFTLSDALTLELGFSGATGPNDSAGTTWLGAADLSLKWKPLQKNTYRSFTWQSEWLYGDVEAGNAGRLASNGFYSLFTWQFARRWFFTGRVDYAEKPYRRDAVGRSLTAMFGWYATEFQKLELEGAALDETGNPMDYFVKLRWIFVIGSHEAHTY